MAFQQATGNNVRNLNMPARSQNDSWKSDAFINLSIPVRRNDGSTGQTKIGAIQLKLNRDVDAKLIQAFRDDPETATERLIKALIVDYREASQNEGAEVLF